MYVQTLTTRGYETDTQALVPIHVVLSYLEHLRWGFIQSEEAALKDELARGYFPVVASQSVELVQRIGMDVPLELTARLEEVGRSQVVLRHAIIDRRDRSLVAELRVRGLWLGPTRRLARIPDALRALAARHAEEAGPEFQLKTPTPHYPDEGPLVHTAPRVVVHAREGLDMGTFEDPPTPTYRHTLTVRPRELDIFSHVNAATYPRYCHDARVLAHRAGAIPDAANGPFRKLAIVYDREAILDDELAIDVAPSTDDDRGLWYTIRRAKDETVLCRARGHA